jgi:predicted ATP-dependent protease
MIPAQNAKNLMLRKELIEAVAAGRFHIFAVNTIDEGIEILTGCPAGKRVNDGGYEEGTINHRVDRRLKEFTQGLQKFSTGEGPLREHSEGAGEKE